MSKSTTRQIINKTLIPGTTLGDALEWLRAGNLPPGGAAGGVLSGSFPNPGFAQDMATQAELDDVVAAVGVALANKAPLTGAGTSGTWSISITGNAASATAATTATNAANLSSLAGLPSGGATVGYVLKWNGSAWVPAAESAGGVTDHGALSGLADDDHTQYYNQTRGDARYEQLIAAGAADQYWAGNKTWQNFALAVRSAVLTGLSTATNAAVVATDTVLVAIGKLQAQISNLKTINGTSILGPGNIVISGGGGGGLTFAEVTTTSQAVSVGVDYHMTNAAVTTLTAPSTANPGDTWGWAVCNGRLDNVINWNGLKHEDISDTTTTLTGRHAAGTCVYVNATYGWKIK